MTGVCWKEEKASKENRTLEQKQQRVELSNKDGWEIKRRLTS